MNGFKKMFHGTLICPKLLKVDIYRLYINIQYRYIIVMPKKVVISIRIFYTIDLRVFLRFSEKTLRWDTKLCPTALVMYISLSYNLPWSLCTFSFEDLSCLSLKVLISYKTPKLWQNENTFFVLDTIRISVLVEVWGL